MLNEHCSSQTKQRKRHKNTRTPDQTPRPQFQNLYVQPIECIVAKEDSDTLAHFEQVKFWTPANESAVQYCWMQPMNISMEEDKWDVDNFKMHKEGFGKIGKDDRFFTFTYYQWCAFFFLLQVRTSALEIHSNLFLSRRPVSQLPA